MPKIYKILFFIDVDTCCRDRDAYTHHKAIGCFENYADAAVINIPNEEDFDMETDMKDYPHFLDK